MSDMLFTAAQPFKRKGTDCLKESEFVMALSMDLNWFKPDTAKAFVQAAVDNGIIARDGGMLKAQFSLDDVEIPMGFKPDASVFQEKDVFEQIVDRIMAETGLEKRSIVASINKKRSETAGLFTIEVLGILVAKEHGVMVDDLIGKSYRNLLKG
ncbi:MAG: DUF2240 family protein [Methanosarcinales archaeon]|nr:DUF2240 family protein [ANME-2 cluster archaeon]MDF1531826.1 DUF2240 family protein [ANME-2 cluster archaeon]MDW7776402.1 DUF2240 family protein [Methanosarcinales archaeon]